MSLGYGGGVLHALRVYREFASTIKPRGTPWFADHSFSHSRHRSALLQPAATSTRRIEADPMTDNRSVTAAANATTRSRTLISFQAAAKRSLATSSANPRLAGNRKSAESLSSARSRSRATTGAVAARTIPQSTAERTTAPRHRTRRCFFLVRNARLSASVNIPTRWRDDTVDAGAGESPLPVLHSPLDARPHQGQSPWRSRGRLSSDGPLQPASPFQVVASRALAAAPACSNRRPASFASAFAAARSPSRQSSSALSRRSSASRRRAP